MLCIYEIFMYICVAVTVTAIYHINSGILEGNSPNYCYYLAPLHIFGVQKWQTHVTFVMKSHIIHVPNVF